MAKQNGRQVTTNEVRLSYLRIWKPAAPGEMDEGKYSASIIIPKSDIDTLNAINKAVEVAKAEGMVSKFGNKTANLHMPLRDGDLERPEDEAYANSYFINCKSKTRPGIVDVKRQPIFDETEVYSGCYGLVAITFYAFASTASKGVACGLEHIMKTKDGEAFAGGRSVDEAFGDVDTTAFDDDDDSILD